MSRAGALLGILLLVSCTPDSNVKRGSRSDTKQDVYRLLVLTDPQLRQPGLTEIVRGVEVALDSGPELLGKKVVLEQPPETPSVLAGVSDDPDVIGVITYGGRDSIALAMPTLMSSKLPVFELRDDLYDASAIGGGVFQMAAPHSWEAFRLMRYFGPGDRGYKKVAVIHDTSKEGLLAFDALTEAAKVRGIEVLEAAGTADQAAKGGIGMRPDAVVVEGSSEFNTQVLEFLSQDAYRYKGKPSIRDGSRPQVGGFSSMLRLAPPTGTVAAGDYARAVESGDIIEPVKSFRDAFKQKFGRDPVGDEALGFDAASALLEAAKRAGSIEHPKVLAELEKFDRVRFGHLPLSLGPTDHVGAERDVLGLWAVPDDAKKWKGQGHWRYLMRAFTSDLERTNILEEDWASFFEGSTPGGEAPFFNTSRWGITSDKSDPMH